MSREGRETYVEATTATSAAARTETTPRRGDERGGDRRRGPVVWTYDAGHGVIDGRALQSLGDASVCRLALDRTAFGGPPVTLLASLPGAPAVRRRPVPGQGGFAEAAPRPERRAAEAPVLAGESVASYIERRMRQAATLVLPNRATSYRIAKRAIDVVAAAVLIVLTSPVMLAVAALIRIDSRGPAVFRQQRVTRGGRPFTFYKFRTMYVDARERFADLYDYEFGRGEFTASYYKLADDPRNTRVGRWLRRTTLDELPNLFNVLKGDLSLVGPRPEIPELVPHYPPENLACFFTKAGLTGLAQVAGRSLLTVDERLTLDTRYVANQSLLLDLRILARTVGAVVKGIGAF